MKIDNRVRLLKALEPTTAAVKRNPQEASAAQASNSGAVKVSSDFGGKVSNPEDNSAKVAALKAQVAAGTYSVDSGKAAEALVGELGVIRG